ncbi:apolipoprotein L2-like isoform X1 [Polypterus senegalus]|uniref:apolipoprotein L2-like isoform X1 n=1 Tax=Polypterus senegalus TaxID=55291 RepID=UPI0019658065|nr:apolipoprotein L2-like isoform X1 [Polypterus senegalus]XP_039621243.1 apolipoprotein L2-like isoform X1 [Polypterus senegalus]
MNEASIHAIPLDYQLLEKIREDAKIRSNLIFADISDDFMMQFEVTREELQTCLQEIEKIAQEMDTVKKNAAIVSVAGSTAGVISGVLCITGLALAPVTFGVSTILTAVGTGVGVAAGVGGVATGITESVLNRKDKEKIKKLFEIYAKAVNEIRDVLGIERLAIDAEASSGEAASGINAAHVAAKVASGVPLIVDDIARIADAASDGAAAIGRAVDGAADAAAIASRSAAIAGGVFSGLFIGVDIINICSNGYDLAKGQKNVFAKAIRKIAGELESELDSYRNLYEVFANGRESVSLYKQTLDKEQITLSPLFSSSDISIGILLLVFCLIFYILFW